MAYYPAASNKPKATQQPGNVFENAPGMGMFPEYGVGDGSSGNNSFFRTEPFAPGKPTSYKDTLNKQIGTANDLTQNFEKYSDERFNPLATAERGKLTQNLRGVKNNFNSRGLLGSGLQSDSEAGARAASNSRLRDTRSGINQGLLGDINTARGNAFDLASLMSQGGPNTAQLQLDQLAQQIALSSDNDALAGQAYGNLSTGVGKLGGAFVNGQKRN